MGPLPRAKMNQETFCGLSLLRLGPIGLGQLRRRAARRCRLVGMGVPSGIGGRFAAIRLLVEEPRVSRRGPWPAIVGAFHPERANGPRLRLSFGQAWVALNFLSWWGRLGTAGCATACATCHSVRCPTNVDGQRRRSPHRTHSGLHVRAANAPASCGRARAARRRSASPS